MKLRALTLLFALVLNACGARYEHATADLVVRNADVRTQDPTAPAATALAISGDKIIYVGDEQGVTEWIGPNTRVIDAGGNTVLPGLIDTHIHAAEGALSLGGCTLNNKELKITEAADTIRACVAADKTSTWIVVNAVNPAGFKAHRHDLDAIERERPLFLWGADGHTAWVNTRGLELAGITRATPDPDAGRIDRDAKGDATGFLVEGATGLALSKMEKATPAQRLDALRKVLPLLHGTGITSYLEANTDEPTVDAYAELAKLHELTARVTVAYDTSLPGSPEEFKRLRGFARQAHRSPVPRRLHQTVRRRRARAPHADRGAARAVQRRARASPANPAASYSSRPRELEHIHHRGRPDTASTSTYTPSATAPCARPSTPSRPRALPAASSCSASRTCS